MAKRTKKYVAAEQAAKRIGLQVSAGHADALYTQLNAQGYQWNSEAGTWDDWGALEADQPSGMIRIRCWAAGESVGLIADGVVEAMLAAGLQLVERSQPYPCRPPQQLESRVYLSFVAGHG